MVLKYVQLTNKYKLQEEASSFFVLNKEEQKDNFSVFSVTGDGHAGTKRLFIGNVDGLKYWNQMTFMGSFNLVTLMW